MLLKRRKNIKKPEVTAIPWFLGQWGQNGLSSPAQYVLLWCLSVPVCPPAFLCLFSCPLHSLSFPNFPFDSAAFSIFWNVDVLLVDTVHEW